MVEDVRRSATERRPEPDDHALRLRSLGLAPEAGNQALGRTLARLKETRVGGKGGEKVKYAENEREATELCRAEALQRGLNWDGLEEVARQTIITIAMRVPKLDGPPAGIKAAYDIIYAEKHEEELAEARQERRDAMDAPGSEYRRLSQRVAFDPILVSVVDLMKEIYIGGTRGKVNVTLGTKHPTDDIDNAVARWRQARNWVGAQLQLVTNPHGYDVGPKDPQVGDTLDRRGNQGNVIAFWSGVKINVHLDPDD
jgi:hypothetical protein